MTKMDRFPPFSATLRRRAVMLRCKRPESANFDHSTNASKRLPNTKIGHPKRDRSHRQWARRAELSDGIARGAVDICAPHHGKTSGQGLALRVPDPPVRGSSALRLAARYLAKDMHVRVSSLHD